MIRGGEPIKLQKLALRNDTGRPRKLSLTYYVEWTLGETRESSQMHVVTAWDDEAQAMLARNHYHPDYANRVAFAAVSAPTGVLHRRPHGLSGAKPFVGQPGRDGTQPIFRVGRERAWTRAPRVQVTLKLAPGERAEITCMLGQAQSVEQALALVKAYRDELRALETALRAHPGLVGRPPWHDPGAYPRTGHRLPDQPVACSIRA